MYRISNHMNLVRIEFVKKKRFQNKLNEINQNIHPQIFFLNVILEIQSSDDSCRENCSRGKVQACDPAVFMDQHGQLRQWDGTILRNIEHSRDIHIQIYKLSLRSVKDEEKQLKDLPSLKAVLQKVKQRFLHHICNLFTRKNGKCQGLFVPVPAFSLTFAHCISRTFIKPT